MTSTTAIAADSRAARAEMAPLVALATRTVPPLWPLESIIAVNPLAGFEEFAFADALRKGEALLGMDPAAGLAMWRDLAAAGRIDRDAVLGQGERFFPGLLAGSAEGALPGRRALLEARLFDVPRDQAFDPAVRTLFAGMATKAPETASVACTPLDRAGEPAMSRARGSITRWCAAFFDRTGAGRLMPGRANGLYAAARALAAHDPDFRQLAGGAGKAAALIRSLPDDALVMIHQGLETLGITPNETLALLQKLVGRLPGWSGHIRWRNEHADDHVRDGAPAGMADLLAIWLMAELAAKEQGKHGAATAADAPAATVAAHLAAYLGLTAERLAAMDEDAAADWLAVAMIADTDLLLLFQAAVEERYRAQLLPRLAAKAETASKTVRSADRPDAQLVFCIDVRSEPFRRAIEAEGRYETFGYAGFFGLPVAIHRPGEERVRQLPVLIAPQHDIRITPRPGDEQKASRALSAAAGERHIANRFAELKAGAATGFATAEITGPLAAGLMVAANWFPKAWAKRRAKTAAQRDASMAPCVDHGCGGHQFGLSLEEQATYAQGLFVLTGMPAETARLVVLTGHGGETVNNLYGTALDCGACGGHAGSPNARMLATILNNPAVREALKGKGITLPEDSWFLAGQHNTTTDTVELFETDTIPEGHQDDLARLQKALARAGARNRAVRAPWLGQRPAELKLGAVHWGEVRPEWGLARNAAFIIAPRGLTRELDLEGRCFLHSYDWRSDTEGDALATIMTAPLVVAQWINNQYLFSTLDNAHFGAGDKTTHNAVGGLGVVQGNGGDLCVGLPRQSLFGDDGTAWHEPVRLLAVIHAPAKRVQRIIRSHEILQRLFGNGWIQVAVIDPVTGKTHVGAEVWEGRAAPEPRHGTVPAPETAA